MSTGKWDQSESFSAYTKTIMPDWSTPGIAIGIIQNDEVIFSAGFGYRDREKRLPVTPQTLFVNASTSKAFTSAAIGMLVDEGKLDWDTPVRQYLPEFKLVDPVATERLTLRDLLSHRTGMPRHDKVWYNSTVSRSELVASLQYLEPNCDLRTTYQYNNLMFVTAGYVLERVTGVTWEGFVRERIFSPLGMTRSNFSVHDSAQDSDHALPYDAVGGKGLPIPFRAVDNIGPAGGINSCIEDMLPWLRLHLNGGKHGADRLISEKNLQETHTPQMLAQSFVPGRHAELPMAAYGLGWFIEPYRGHQVVYHVGSLDGFYAYVSMLPEARAGVVIFTNICPSRLPYILCYNIYDRLLGLPEIDWNRRLLEEVAKVDADEERQREAVRLQRDEKKPPSLPLAAYAGTYIHPGYGSITVGLADGALQLTFHDITVPLRHNHGEMFELVGEVKPFRPVMTVTFKPGDGKVANLTAPFEPAPKAKEIVFNRV